MTKTTKIRMIIDLLDEAMSEQLHCVLIPKSSNIESGDDWYNLFKRIKVLGYNQEALVCVDECDFYKTAECIKWEKVWDVFDLVLLEDVDHTDYSRILWHRWDLDKIEYIKINQVKI